MDFLQKLDFMMKKYSLNKNTLSLNSGIPYTTIDGWYKKGYEGMKISTLRILASYFNTVLDFWIQDEITDPNYGKRAFSEKNPLGAAEAAPGKGPLSPPGYSFLSPANRIIADQIVDVLLKNQPQNVVPFPVNSVAYGGAESKTELDSDVTLPNNTKVLPAQDKAGTDDEASAPEET